MAGSPGADSEDETDVGYLFALNILRRQSTPRLVAAMAVLAARDIRESAGAAGVPGEEDEKGAQLAEQAPGGPSGAKEAESEEEERQPETAPASPPTCSERVACRALAPETAPATPSTCPERAACRTLALRRGCRLKCWDLPRLRAAVAASVDWEGAKRALTGNRVGRRDSVCFVWAHPREPSLCVCAVVNGYGPRGAVAHHSDDERQVCRWADVLTYSFGRSMPFEIKDKRSAFSHRERTGHGTMIAMAGARFQRDYTHAVLRSDVPAGADDYRISVSLRVCWKRPTRHYTFGRTALRAIAGGCERGAPLETLARLCSDDALEKWGTAGRASKRKPRRLARRKAPKRERVRRGKNGRQKRQRG